MTVTMRSTTNQLVDLSTALAGVSDDARITLSVSGPVKAQVWPYAFASDWIGNGQSRSHAKRFLVNDLAAITRSATVGSGVSTWTLTAPGFSYTVTFNVDDAPPTEWDYGAKTLARYGGYPIAQFLPGTATDWTILSQSTANAFTIEPTTNCVSWNGATFGATTKTVGTPATGAGAYTVTLQNTVLGQTHTISFNVIANRWDVDSNNTRIGGTGNRPMNYGDEVVINDPLIWGDYNNPTRGNPETFFTAGARSQRAGGPAAPTGPYLNDSWEPQKERNAGWIVFRPRTPWAVNLNRFQLQPPTGGFSYTCFRYFDSRNNATPSTGAILSNHNGNQMHWIMLDRTISSDLTIAGNQTVIRSNLFALDNCVGYNPAPAETFETNGITVTGTDCMIVGNLIDGPSNDAIIYCLVNSTYGSGKSKLWWNTIRNKKYSSTGIHGDFMQLYGVNTVLPQSAFIGAANADKIFEMSTELGNVCFRGDGSEGNGSTGHGGAGNTGKDMPDGQGSWAGDWNPDAGSYVGRIVTAGMIYVGTFLGGIGRKWAAPGTTVKNTTMIWPSYLTNLATGLGMSSPALRILGLGGKVGVADCAIAGVVNPESNDTVTPPTPVTDNNVTSIGTDSSAHLTSPASLATAQYLEQVIDAMAPKAGGPLTVAGGATRVVGAVGSGLIDHLKRTHDASVLNPLAGVPTTQATWDAAATPSGTPTVGNTLTMPNFAWDDTVTVLNRAWLRNGTTISGATGTTYVLQAADAGTTIKAVERVEDSQGNRIAAASVGVAVT